MSWMADAKKLSPKHAAGDYTSASDLSEAMAELWALVQTCPDDVIIAYRSIQEADLQRAADGIDELLIRGRLNWEAGDNLREAARGIGAALRSLDLELAGRPRSKTLPKDGRTFRAKGVDAYVIPRPTAK